MDFGVSDMPLAPGELAKYGLVQFPLVIGGVVPVVNIDGVKQGELHFSGGPRRHLSRKNYQLERSGVA